MKLFIWIWLVFYVLVFVKINAISNKGTNYRENHQIRDKAYQYEIPNRKYLPSSHGIDSGHGGGGGYGLHGDFGNDYYYGHGYDYHPDISYEGGHDFTYHGNHHLQPIPQPHYPNPGHKKAVALKSFLLPLAGAALIGAAALLVSNPVLLQLGVVSGKRRRRDVPSDGPYRAYVDRRRIRDIQ